MSTHDYVIDNQSAVAFRADLNSALAAIVTQNSSGVAPTTTFANMIWYDTATNQIKKRNEANSGWIILGTIDEVAGTFTPSGTVAIATQAEAQAGTDNTKMMTPLRSAQAIAALSTFTHEYVSSNQTITTGGLLTLAHGLGQVPKVIFFELICVTAQAGFSVNDVITVGVNNSTSGGSRIWAVYYTTTNISVRFPSAEPSVIVVSNKTTGATEILTNANWRLRVRAFA